MRYRKWLVTLVLATLPIAGAAQQQSFPSRPIRLVIPQAVGGTTDTISRAIGQALATQLGVAVIADNRPGASGNIGTDIVAKAPADGYTLVAANSNTHSINPNVYEKLPFDPIKDFAPVALAGYTTNILVVRNDFPAKTLKELIDYAKANPGKLNYGSAGVGSSPHLAAEMFKSMTGTQITHVPYKGSTPSVHGLVAGEVDLMFTGLTSVSSLVQAGKLRVLSVNSSKRSSVLPDVPTAAEAGMPGLDLSFWIGLLAPAGTPQPVIDKLASETIKSLQQPDVRQSLSAQGVEVVPEGPDALAKLIKTDLERWRDVIRSANIKPE
jgi:tripartite-type tricarboxylate transporter receptor subunit TctC